MYTAWCLANEDERADLCRKKVRDVMGMQSPTSSLDIVFACDTSGSMKSTVRIGHKKQAFYRWMHDAMRTIYDNVSSDVRCFVQMFGSKNKVKKLFEITSPADLRRVLPFPDANELGYYSVTIPEYDLVCRELRAAERDLQMTGENNIDAAMRVIAAREAMDALALDEHTLYDGPTYSLGIRAAFKTFGVERPAIVIILSDGKLDDPDVLADFLLTINCSSQHFPAILLGIIGDELQVQDITTQFRDASLSLSRQDVPFRVHNLVLAASHGDAIGFSLYLDVLSEMHDCSMLIPDARRLRISKNKSLVLPDAKYCRPQLIADVLLHDVQLFECAHEYITRLFVNNDLAALTSSNSAASLLYASLMAMEGVSKRSGLPLPLTYPSMRRHIADAIHEFRKGSGAHATYTDTTRQEILKALDEFLNSSKKNVGLDTDLRKEFEGRFPTTGICVSAPPDDYGALVQKQKQWKHLAITLVRSISCSLIDDDMERSKNESRAGLILPESADDLSSDELLKLFRILPSIGDRGVVLSSRYAFMIVGVVLSTSGVNGYLMSLARAFARRVDMYAALNVDRALQIFDVFSENAPDDVKEIGMGTFREALIAINRHRIFDGVLEDLSRFAFTITWLTRVVHGASSTTIPVTRLERVEYRQQIGQAYDSRAVQDSLPLKYQDTNFAEIVGGASIVRHIFSRDGDQLQPVVLGDDLETTLSEVGVYYYYPPDVDLAQTITFSKHAPDSIQQRLTDAISMVMAKSLMLFKIHGVVTTLADFIRNQKTLAERILFRRQFRFVTHVERHHEELSVRELVCRFGETIGIPDEIVNSFSGTLQSFPFSRQVQIYNTLLDVVQQGFFSAAIRYEVSATWKGYERILDATGVRILNDVFRNTFDEIVNHKDAETSEFPIYTCCISLMSCARDDPRRPAFVNSCGHAMCIPEAVKFVEHAVYSCPFVGVKCGWCRADISNVDSLELTHNVAFRFSALTVQETPADMWKSMCFVCEETAVMLPKEAMCGAIAPRDRDFVCSPCDARNAIVHMHRPCPSCNVEVQKISGCDHITCSCGEHWCWRCGQAFDSNFIYTHLMTCQM